MRKSKHQKAKQRREIAMLVGFAGFVVFVALPLAYAVGSLLARSAGIN